MVYMSTKTLPCSFRTFAEGGRVAICTLEAIQSHIHYTYK